MLLLKRDHLVRGEQRHELGSFKCLNVRGRVGIAPCIEIAVGRIFEALAAFDVHELAVDNEDRSALILKASAFRVPAKQRHDLELVLERTNVGAQLGQLKGMWHSHLHKNGDSRPEGQLPPGW